MTVFAVDSSGAAGSAALLRDGELLAEDYANEGLTHSETLLLRCDACFKKAGLTPAGVDCFAVAAGPGSFTGLRIGMGLIKGMAFAAGRPCAAVSTFAALAEQAGEGAQEILAVLDARQKRVYCAGFRREAGALVQTLPDGILPLSELAAAAEKAGLSRPQLAGDAADAAFEALGGRCEAAGEPLRFLRASSVARVAARMAAAGQTVSANALRPFYLLPSQAERMKQLQNESKEGKQQ